MKIDDHILHKWKLILERGDQTRISEQFKISKFKISLALNYGKADAETFRAIKKFAEEKEKKELKLKSDVSPY